jgi:hypothetical protein
VNSPAEAVAPEREVKPASARLAMFDRLREAVERAYARGGSHAPSIVA